MKPHETYSAAASWAREQDGPVSVIIHQPGTRVAGWPTLPGYTIRRTFDGDSERVPIPDGLIYDA